ncbi:TATA box-binding protein, partial [Candidatus Bathyarchaeota archaeon]
VNIKDDALEKLTEIGVKSSLRYAVQLLSLAAQNAKVAKRETVTIEDVERVGNLFMDVNEAAEHLRKYEEKLMYH